LRAGVTLALAGTATAAGCFAAYCYHHA